MNLKPKKCTHCHKPVEAIQTDGIDLYVKGERMPREMVEAMFPCPHCDTGLIRWKRGKEEGVVNASK